jgi:predicted Fe-Mo cluster-binding NifX family protein
LAKNSPKHLTGYNEKSIDSGVCQSFGRAPYFLIYDTDSEQSEFIDNKAAVSQGGAGIKAAQTVVDANISALLTPRCGENAAEVIKGAAIKIYKTIDDTALGNIKAFIDGELSLLEEIHPGFHGRGNR